ncbi:MAG: hypothetical protein R3Y51_01070 [Rikenellaceae bacterium]
MKNVFKSQFVKSLLCVAFLLAGTVTSVVAQSVMKFKTTDFAYKVNEGNGWTEWSDWEESSILVVIDSNKDVITIYSEGTQEFDIYEYEGQEKSRDGGTIDTYNSVDADGVRCQIRLRDYDDSSQLYVDYSNIMYVYNIAPR